MSWGRPDDAQRRPGAVQDDPGPRLKPPQGAVVTEDTVLGIEVRSLGHGFPKSLVQPIDIYRMDMTQNELEADGDIPRRVSVQAISLVRPPDPARRGLHRPASHTGDPLDVGELPVPAAQGEERHRRSAQGAEGRELWRGRLARLSIDHAQGAEGVALGRDEGRARVEADVGIGGHERVAGEALVRQGVRHHEDVVLEDGVGAERNVSRGLARGEPHLRLEPLAILVDQGDEGDWRGADLGREARQVVEGLFSLRVEDLVGAEGLQPLALVRGKGCLHEPPLVRAGRGFASIPWQRSPPSWAASSRGGRLRMRSAWGLHYSESRSEQDRRRHVIGVAPEAQVVLLQVRSQERCRERAQGVPDEGTVPLAGPHSLSAGRRTGIHRYSAW